MSGYRMVRVSLILYPCHAICASHQFFLLLPHSFASHHAWLKLHLSVSLERRCGPHSPSVTSSSFDSSDRSFMA